MPVSDGRAVLHGQACLTGSKQIERVRWHTVVNVVRGQRLERPSPQASGAGSRRWMVAPTRPIGLTVLALDDGVG